MTAENYILAIVAGFVVGWIANMMTRSRYSFPINLFVGIFGSILLTFFIRTADLMDTDHILSGLLISLTGSTVLLLLFHVTRLTEKR